MAVFTVGRAETRCQDGCREVANVSFWHRRGLRCFRLGEGSFVVLYGWLRTESRYRVFAWELEDFLLAVLRFGGRRVVKHSLTANDSFDWGLSSGLHSLLRRHLDSQFSRLSFAPVDSSYLLSET